MKRKIIVSLVLVAGILALGAGGAWYLIATAKVVPTAAVDRTPLLVSVLKVEPGTVVEPLIGYGTARAERYARISSQVAGTIIELPEGVKHGAHVKEGDLLLRIDSRDYEANLARAKSMITEVQAGLSQLKISEASLDDSIKAANELVKIAEWDYERLKGLFDQGVAPEAEYKNARYRWEKALLDLQPLETDKRLLPEKRNELNARLENYTENQKLAQLNVERCRIIAPFDGQIDLVSVELGEQIAPGLPLLSVSNADVIDVPIELPASARPRVKAGTSARLSVDTIEGVTWTGQVKRISPGARELMRTFELYMEVENASQDVPLMPGYFVRAVIDGRTLTDAIVIPRGVIQDGRVFLCEAGVARVRDIQVETHLLDQSVVTGLKPGEIVITSNLDVLYDGVRVRYEGDGTGSTGTTATNPARELLTHKR